MKKSIIALVLFSMIGIGITSCSGEFEEIRIETPEGTMETGGSGGGPEGGDPPPCPTC